MHSKIVFSKRRIFYLAAVGLVIAMTLPGTVRADDSTPNDVHLDSKLQLTWVDGNAAADEAGEAKAAKAANFLQGSWSFQAYGSATVGDDAGELYLAHAGLSYFLFDNFSVSFEGLGGVVDAEAVAGASDRDGSTIGFDLLARWFFAHQGGFSVYAEGGIGMIWLEDAFPVNGTHQNFTPQVGMGAIWRATDNLHIMGGVRWHHISNARKSGKNNNPGFDGAMIYAGIMIPF